MGNVSLKGGAIEKGGFRLPIRKGFLSPLNQVLRRNSPASVGIKMVKAIFTGIAGWHQFYIHQALPDHG
jgi:hypothetical protein